MPTSTYQSVSKVTTISQPTTNQELGSTVEPGIGITASAMATLRPLFINFFSRSKFLGSSTHDGVYRNSKSRNKIGYIRSTGDVELGVKSGGTKNSGITVTTVIKSEQDERKSARKSGSAWPLRSGEDNRLKELQVVGDGVWEGGSSNGHVKTTTWNSSESRLTDASYSL